MMAYGDKRYEPSAEASKVTELRKNGRLREAYIIAREYYARGCREETFMQSYTWVLYDCLKRYYKKDTKFYQSISAYCSALAQIRKFPTNPSRDEMFIENLERHVLKVGWALRKEGRNDDLAVLCNELRLWSLGSPLYTEGVARMLLVSTKPYGQSATVLQWLGIADAPWSAVASGQCPANVPSEIAGSALAWAFYDDLKSYAGDDNGNGVNIRDFIHTLSAIRAIIPNEFNAHETAVYASGKLVSIGWRCRERKNIDQIEQLLNEVVQWGQDSSMHRPEVLTMLFVSLQDRPADVLRIVTWYGLDKLDHDAYKPRLYEGKELPSQAQDLIKAYLDALISKDQAGNPAASQEMKNAGCDQVASLLEDQRCADWVWESYKLGKLLCETGRYVEARKRLAPIVAKSQSEPWAWHAYGKAWEAESSEIFEKCLFMGLSVSKNAQFARSLHEDAAVFFERTGRYAEAKTEILLLDRICEENGWRPSENAAALKSAEWYDRTTETESNDDLYLALSQGAETVVSQDLPWSEFYAEWTNMDKGLICVVVQNHTKSAFSRIVIKDSQAAAAVEEGRCYRGHFGPENKSMIGEIEEFPEASISKHFIATFEGQIGLVNNYGFVNSGNLRVWVSPALLDGKEAKQFQEARGACRKIYKAPKDSPSAGKWAWEATVLTLGDEADESTYRIKGTGDYEPAMSRIGPRGFGFIRGRHSYRQYFVPANLVKEYGLKDEQEIDFIAEKSWDTKKNRWGWKVVEIIEARNPDWW